ncbi:MAG: N-acetylgalactosamine 6-sulfate sulfatase [Deltaproteobacteria bacterium]|nr:MAG: N-acetylgalactosamine 6-sulfate sulfatase [Deltaproteobacteria bacterium]
MKKIILIFLAMTGILFSTTLGQSGEKKPNIIFIMVDDLGYADLGCYGQEQILTPNIDQLAKEGTRYTQVYAGATVCAPSRSCLMTGTHGGNTRVRDNLPHGVFLQPDDVTVAEVLKKAGYKTAGIGKWSLGNPGSWGIPIYQGFDEYFGQLNQDQAHFYYPDYLWDNDKVKLLVGNRGGEKGEYTHDLFTERALDVIDRNKQNNFFLYLSYTIPHYSDYDMDSPLSQVVPSDEPYTDKDWPQVEKNYAAMVTRMDNDVGSIMKLLKDLSIDDNTIVFFTSDNGPCDCCAHQIEFFDSNGELRGVKRDMYEGGIRIPMIVRWPDQVPAGRVSETMWAFWDFLPTVEDIAGLPISKNVNGISYLNELLGKPQTEEHEYFYWDYGHVRDTYMQAVRFGKWKGINMGVNAPFELYDLSTDIGETNNVAEANPDMVAQIKAKMEEAYVASEDYPIGGHGK